MSKQKIVVVGNGMVGHKFIDNLIQHPQADLYDVITFAEEPRLAYTAFSYPSFFLAPPPKI
jgi:nitrite reductase (NADH) large subunit